MTLDAGHDGSLLDSGRLLETVGVDATKQLLPEGHVVKVLANVIPIGVDEALRVHAGRSVIAVSLARGRPWPVRGPARLVATMGGGSKEKFN